MSTLEAVVSGKPCHAEESKVRAGEIDVTSIYTQEASAYSWWRACSIKALSHKASTSASNSTTHWRLGVRTPEPVGTFLFETLAGGGAKQQILEPGSTSTLCHSKYFIICCCPFGIGQISQNKCNGKPAIIPGRDQLLQVYELIILTAECIVL